MSQHKICKFSQVSKKPSPCPTSPITFHLVIKCDSVSVLSSAVPRQQKHSVASLMSAYKSKYLLPPVLCRENQLGLSHIWWNSGWCYYRGEVIWRKVRLKTQGRSKMLCISRGAESRECWLDLHSSAVNQHQGCAWKPLSATQPAAPVRAQRYTWVPHGEIDEERDWNARREDSKENRIGL